MVVKQIKPDWWCLTSDDGIRRLMFFGQSRAEVIGKFRAWIRYHDLERIRVRHGPGNLARSAPTTTPPQITAASIVSMTPYATGLRKSQSIDVNPDKQSGRIEWDIAFL